MYTMDFLAGILLLENDAAAQRLMLQDALSRKVVLVEHQRLYRL